jgi:hypothetical protein
VASQGTQHAELWLPHSSRKSFQHHDVDLPDVHAAHKEATMTFGDMARDVAAHLSETPEVANGCIG